MRWTIAACACVLLGCGQSTNGDAGSGTDGGTTGSQSTTSGSGSESAGSTSGGTSGGGTSSTDGTSSSSATATTSTTGSTSTSDTTSGAGTGDTTGSWTTTGTTSGLCDQPELPDPAPGEECDIWLNDCAEGYKCAAFSRGGGGYDAHKCVPIPCNGKHAGEPCTASFETGVDDCDAGSMCWVYGPDLSTLVCATRCTGANESEADCADPCATCFVPDSGMVNPCLPGCDPLGNDCGVGQTCIHEPIQGTFYCLVDMSGQDGQAGDPCEHANDCDPGLVCEVAADVPGCVTPPGCCTLVCDPGVLAACQTVQGSDCVVYDDPAPDPSCPAAGLGRCIEP